MVNESVISIYLSMCLFFMSIFDIFLNNFLSGIFYLFPWISDHRKECYLWFLYLMISTEILFLLFSFHWYHLEILPLLSWTIDLRQRNYYCFLPSKKKCLSILHHSSPKIIACFLVILITLRKIISSSLYY